MTLPLEIVAGWAAGAAFALAAAEPLSQTSYPTKTRYFAVTTIFAGGALVPAACVLYALYPDWSLMYLASPAQLPLLLMLPLVIVLCFGAPILGFLSAQRLILAHRAKTVRAMLYGAAILSLLVAIAGHARLSSLGHYEAFHYGGDVLPIAKSQAIVVLGSVASAVLIAFTFAYRRMRKHIRALADVAEGVPLRAGER